MVRYKVIYKKQGSKRGENYTGNSHTLSEAIALKNKGENFSKRHRENSTFKIVRVNSKKIQRSEVKFLGFKL